MGILDPAYTGVLVLAVAGILAQISMMSFQCDQFAVDRAGLTLTFLTPATGREIVFGKAAGGLAAFAIPVGIGTIAAVALHPRGSPAVWIGAIGCVFAAYLAQSPFAALMAAWFPAPFDLSRLRGGNPHPLASILSSVLAVLVFALCGGIFAATLAFTQRPLVGLGAAIVVLASAATFSRWAMGLVGRVLDARRENLAMMAQGR